MCASSPAPLCCVSCFLLAFKTETQQAFTVMLTRIKHPDHSQIWVTRATRLPRELSERVTRVLWQSVWTRCYRSSPRSLMCRCVETLADGGKVDLSCRGFRLLTLSFFASDVWCVIANVILWGRNVEGERRQVQAGWWTPWDAFSNAEKEKLYYSMRLQG